MEIKIKEMLRRLEFVNLRKIKLCSAFGLDVFEAAVNNEYIEPYSWDSEGDPIYGLSQKGRDFIK